MLVLGMGIQIFLHALEFLFAFSAAAMHRTVLIAASVNQTSAEVVSQWMVMRYMVLQKYKILDSENFARCQSVRAIFLLFVSPLPE